MWPKEYELEAIGPTQRLRETLDAIGFAFVVALISMYMILAAQFNSFTHPLTIMLWKGQPVVGRPSNARSSSAS